jgi:hypothetical protein
MYLSVAGVSITKTVQETLKEKGRISNICYEINMNVLLFETV